jgi:prolipoprotein diacylglyceryltransferase
MYPKLSDLINDWFGTNITLPIQSYGFFLALAFLAAGWTLYKELERKEHEGLLKATVKKVQVGKPASLFELLTTFLITLLVIFKLIGIITDYDAFANNPQEFIFSGEGNWWIAFVLASAITYKSYYDRNKKELKPPKWEEVVVHPKDLLWQIVFIAVIFGIIGAKIFDQLENFDDFLKDPIGTTFSFSGLTFYGGFIVAAFALFYFGKKNGIHWRVLGDMVAPGLILAYGIGRIGCHVAGDGDWGIVNTLTKPEWLAFLPDWAWAYEYPHNIINHGVRIPGCTGPHCFQLAEKVFPTPIYETTMGVIIFAILWSIRKRIKTPGMLFAIYLMFNGTERFFIEKIRVNNLYHIAGIEITQAEIISPIIFFAGLILLIVFYKQGNKPKVSG